MNTYLALIIFVVGCLAGYQYRRIWKVGGARWKLWLYGIVAASSILSVGLVPIAYPI